MSTGWVRYDIWMPHLSRDLYEIAGQPCSFAIRCAPGKSPFAEAKFAQIAVDCLLGQQVKSNCRLDVYCVMPNHVHIIVTPNVDGASSLLYVDRVKGWARRELLLAGWKGEMWQKRSYDRLMRKSDDLEQLAAYILGNPVRAGLCSEPSEYPWSGIFIPE